MRAAKDWAVFLILLIAGCFYLFLQVVSIMQNGYSIIKSSGENLIINEAEILYEFRTWLTILLSFAGAITYIRIRKIGWIIGFAVLFLFVAISAGAISTVIRLELIDLSSYFLGLVSILILFCFISLLTKSTRAKFDISGKNIGWALVLTLSLLAIYFF